MAWQVRREESPDPFVHQIGRVAIFTEDFRLLDVISITFVDRPVKLTVTGGTRQKWD
jgi:hypothetical protein